MRSCFSCRVAVFGVIVAYLVGVGCDVPVELPGAGAAWSAPVYIYGSEGLIDPGATLEKIYQPPPAFAIDPGDPASGQATGFCLTVATAEPDELSMILTDMASQAKHALIKVDPPIDVGQMTVDTIGQALSDSARKLLAAGQGIYWLADGDVSAADLEHRVAVVLPAALLTQYDMLEVFTSRTPDGYPLGADRIYLAKGFFYLVTLGESVAACNGLPDDQKFSALVADVIEQEADLKVIHQMLAASAAHILPQDGDGVCGIGCYRESPMVATSMSVQVDQIEQPDRIDLVVLTGCINDVEVMRILDPETDPDFLANLTTQMCRDHMAVLLRKIRTVAPQAYVVVTGYYPVVSEASNLPAGLEVWIATLELDVQEDISTWLDAAIVNFDIFLEAAHPALAVAVDMVNTESPGDDGPMLAFVDPGFGPENALFADDSWLWGLTRDFPSEVELELDLEMFPEDPLFTERFDICFQNVGAEPSLGCLYASLAHPNFTGSQVYADAIVAALRELGVLAEDSEP